MKDEKKDDIEIEDMCKPSCPGCVNSHLKINQLNKKIQELSDTLLAYDMQN